MSRYFRSQLLCRERKEVRKGPNKSYFERGGKEKGHYFRDYYGKEAPKWRSSRYKSISMGNKPHK